MFNSEQIGYTQEQTRDKNRKTVQDQKQANTAEIQRLSNDTNQKKQRESLTHKRGTGERK